MAKKKKLTKAERKEARLRKGKQLNTPATTVLVGRANGAVKPLK